MPFFTSCTHIFSALVCSFDLPIDGGHMLNLTSRPRTEFLGMNTRYLRRAVLAAVVVILCGTTGCAPALANFGSDNLPCETRTTAPTLTSIDPNQARAHSVIFTMQLTGRDFDQRTLVFFNNIEVQTTFVSPTDLHALITTDLLRTVGTVNVYLEKLPGKDTCGDGTSNVLSFSITN
jgi:hypothetical protein